MAADAHAAADFYGTRRGARGGRLLRERLARALAEPAPASRCSGWAMRRPICAPGAGRRALHRADAGAGRRRALAGRRANLSCTVEEDALPFPDLCFDRILLVHGLEAAENARGLLREVWRVLKDDGAAAGGGAEPARPVGACGEHAVRPGPALFAGPDRPPAGGQPVPGGAARHRALPAADPAARWCCAARRCGRRARPAAAPRAWPA